MHLLSVSAYAFRNIDEITLNLGTGFNLIYGDNGAGKTALLEAIYLIARSRSFRTTKLKNIVKTNSKEACVRAEVGSDSGHIRSLAVAKSLNGTSIIRIDGESVKRSSDLARLLPVQILLPGVIDLILDGPNARREFLDWGLFHVEHRYLGVSRRYKRVLIQRAAWMKANHNSSFEEDPWAEQLITGGVQLSNWRHAFLAEMNPHFKEMLYLLDPEISCTLSYLDGGYGTSEAEGRRKLTTAFSRDIRSGVSHYGPHRADLEFKLEDSIARDTASRGQAKVIASAAILANAALFAKVYNKKPVILIDDFGAELDDERRQSFLKALMSLDCQVIATTTDTPSELLKHKGLEETRVFHVKQGALNLK